MSLYAFKPRVQSLLRPAARALHRSGVSATQVTLAAVLGSVSIGAVLIATPTVPYCFLLLPLWLPVRMALNAIDGILAREFGHASALGMYLNELTDVVSDTALILPFAFLATAYTELILGFIGLALLAELAGVLGVLAGASRRHDGPLGKSDRAFVLGAFGLLVGVGHAEVALSLFGWATLNALALLTVIRRVRCGLAERATR